MFFMYLKTESAFSPGNGAGLVATRAFRTIPPFLGEEHAHPLFVEGIHLEIFLIHCYTAVCACGVFSPRVKTSFKYCSSPRYERITFLGGEK